ncbi:MAG: hypothetical protein AAF589_09245 [Planctomycetota bacterium]
MLTVAPADASQIVTAVLDLEDPSVSGANTFETDFTIDVTGFTIPPGSAGVIYTDDDSNSGLRVELDIDFSNPFLPVVNTIKFVGQLGDINHFLTDPPTVDIDATIAQVALEPSGVGSFVETTGSAVSVMPDGKFDSGPTTSLNVVEGMITATITPVIGSAIVETFDLSTAGASSSSLAGGTLSMVSVTYDKTEGGFDFYDVEVTTPLEDALSTFEIDLGGGDTASLQLSITGNLLGQGSFSVISSIPEPASAALVAGLGCLAFVRRR